GVSVAVALPWRDPQRGHDQVGAHAGAGVPAHDPLGEHVHDERDVHEPRPGADVGEIGDPDTVRSRGGGGTSRLRGKVTIEQVTGPFPIRAGDGGADVLDPPDALEAEGPHGPVDRAAGGAGEAFLAAEQGDPLPSSVQALGRHLDLSGDGVGRPGEVADLVLDQSVCDGAGSDAGRILPGPVGACSDRQALLAQDAEDRLDCIALGAHLVDERQDQRLRGSSSPAKKIEARRRISLSSRNLLFSAFRRLISADSSVVTPGRVPSSTSAWASQRRTDSRETPSWRATAAVAAVRVGYSWACSRTSRTHLARSWESIFHGCLSILSDSNSSGIKPGPIQSPVLRSPKPLEHNALNLGKV